MMKKLTEYIVRAIENTYIVEMAYDRKKFKDLIDSLGDQIIENWFLIRYSCISNTKNELINHWRKELIGHIDNICKTTFKMDRRKAIEEVLKGWKELNHNNENNIINYIARKFDVGHINIEDSIINEVVDDWLEYGLEDIIDILSDKTKYIDIVEYVNTI